MTINIQYVGIDTSQTMSAYTTDKLKKLNNKYNWIINAQVHFESQHDPKGNGKICKIELSLPGPRIFATSDESNYEMAVKQTIKDLEKQLNKRKHIYSTY